MVVASLKDHMELMHTDTNGFITVGKRVGDQFVYHRHFVGVDSAYHAVTEILDDEGDIYISNASYHAPKRGIATLHRINLLFADIDCHAKNERASIDSLMYFLENEFFGSKVPYPSEIVFTGRGVQLFWHLAHAPRQALPLWNLVQFKVLKELDSINEFVPNAKLDWNCKDVTRISRLPDTYNTKAKCNAKIIYFNPQVFRLDEIVSGFFPDLEFDREKYALRKKKAPRTPKEHEKGDSKSESSKIVKIYNTLTLLNARAEDFKTLIKLREGDCKGYRDHLLFFYVWTVIDKQSSLEDVERELHALNCLFSKPMSDAKIRTKAKHVYEKFRNQNLKKSTPKQKYEWFDRYIFKNETIINKLNITLEEQRQLKTIKSKEVVNERKRDNQRKARRNENGLTKKQQEKLDRKAKIQELKAQGHSQTVVAEMLELNLKMVKRDWN